MVHGLPYIYHRFYVPAKKGDIPFNDFKLIINDFNKMVMDEVITKGCRFRPLNSLGPIYIERIKRADHINNSSVDWKASLAHREELIKSGKIPYNKETAPDGVKWFILFDTDHIARFRWRKSTTSVKNWSMYSFVPTRGKVGNKTKLKNFLLEDPDRIFIYRERPA